MNDSSTPQTIEQSCEINGSVDEQICSSNEGFSESLCTLSKKELGRKGERRRFVFLRTEGLKSLKLIGSVLLGKPISLPLMALRFALWRSKLGQGFKRVFPRKLLMLKSAIGMKKLQRVIYKPITRRSYTYVLM